MYTETERNQYAYWTYYVSETRAIIAAARAGYREKQLQGKPLTPREQDQLMSDLAVARIESAGAHAMMENPNGIITNRKAV